MRCRVYLFWLRLHRIAKPRTATYQVPVFGPLPRPPARPEGFSAKSRCAIACRRRRGARLQARASAGEATASAVAPPVASLSPLRRHGGRSPRSSPNSVSLGARPTTRHRPRPARGCPSRRRAWSASSCRRRSVCKGRRVLGPAGCLRRASCKVSTTRSKPISGLPSLVSSMLRKPISNAALWMTSVSLRMKARNSSASFQKMGLSFRNSVGCHAPSELRLGRRVPD